MRTCNTYDGIWPTLEWGSNTLDISAVLGRLLLVTTESKTLCRFSLMIFSVLVPWKPQLDKGTFQQFESSFELAVEAGFETENAFFSLWWKLYLPGFCTGPFICQNRCNYPIARNGMGKLSNSRKYEWIDALTDTQQRKINFVDMSAIRFLVRLNSFVISMTRCRRSARWLVARTFFSWLLLSPLSRQQSNARLESEGNGWPVELPEIMAIVKQPVIRERGNEFRKSNRFGHLWLLWTNLAQLHQTVPENIVDVVVEPEPPPNDQKRNCTQFPGSTLGATYGRLIEKNGKALKPQLLSVITALKQWTANITTGKGEWSYFTSAACVSDELSKCCL